MLLIHRYQLIKFKTYMDAKLRWVFIYLINVYDLELVVKDNYIDFSLLGISC